MAAILAALAPAGARADGAQPFLGWHHAKDATGSFFGGTTVGAGRFGVAAELGFPFLSVTLAYGVTGAFDLRAGVSTIYGSMTQLVVDSRLRLHARGGLTVAARLGVDLTVSRPDDGSLRLTMHRDLDVTPGLVLSVRLGSTTFFADTGVDLVGDLSPPPVPLAGPPPPFTLGFQIPVHFGVELPLNQNLAFITRFGVDVPITATAFANTTMPYVSVGLDLTG